MKKVIDGLVKTMIVLTAVAVVCGSVYGCYWVAKTMSYSIFYKDMVKQTVIEMVKAEALK